MAGKDLPAGRQVKKSVEYFLTLAIILAGVLSLVGRTIHKPLNYLKNKSMMDCT